MSGRCLIGGRLRWGEPTAGWARASSRRGARAPTTRPEPPSCGRPVSAGVGYENAMSARGMIRSNHKITRSVQLFNSSQQHAVATLSRLYSVYCNASAQAASDATRGPLSSGRVGPTGLTRHGSRRVLQLLPSIVTVRHGRTHHTARPHLAMMSCIKQRTSFVS